MVQGIKPCDFISNAAERGVVYHKASGGRLTVDTEGKHASSNHNLKIEETELVLTEFHRKFDGGIKMVDEKWKLA